MWGAEKLIGGLRALTDYSYCCYISDLAVRKHYQKQGIGHKPLAYLEKILGNEVSYVLISAFDAIGFMKKQVCTVQI